MTEANYIEIERIAAIAFSEITDGWGHALYVSRPGMKLTLKSANGEQMCFEMTMDQFHALVSWAPIVGTDA
mgnify:CR=1 FL=1